MGYGQHRWPHVKNKALSFADVGQSTWGIELFKNGVPAPGRIAGKGGSTKTKVGEIVVKDRTSAELAESADATVQLMIDRNPESAEAWLARYRYSKQFAVTATTDQTAKATIDGYLDRAFELHQASATKNAHILVSVAERERIRGNTMASVELFQRAIEVDPADTRPYLAISEMVAEPGNPESLDMSIQVLQDGVRAIGNRELPLILPLIRHLSARGQSQDADSYIDTARRTIEGIPDEQRTDYKIQLGYVEALILARENRFADGGRRGKGGPAAGRPPRVSAWWRR